MVVNQNEKKIIMGVPQGSTQSPTLFLSFFDDLNCNIKSHHLYLYGDDSSFLNIANSNLTAKEKNEENS